MSLIISDTFCTSFTLAIKSLLNDEQDVGCTVLHKEGYTHSCTLEDYFYYFTICDSKVVQDYLKKVVLQVRERCNVWCLKLFIICRIQRHSYLSQKFKIDIILLLSTFSSERKDMDRVEFRRMRPKFLRTLFIMVSFQVIYVLTIICRFLNFPRFFYCLFKVL